MFKIAAGTSTITTLATFTGTNGKTPFAGLTLDSSGNLYGTTYSGGDPSLNGGDGYGTVFKIAAGPDGMIGSGAFTTLASFTGGTNGTSPRADLTLDSSGNIYGTASTTVFKIAAGTTTITTLAHLSGSSQASVTLDSSGNLYGTTFTGGYVFGSPEAAGGADNKGTVFKIATGTNTLTTLVTFNNTNGANPAGGLTLDSSGNLYGTTYYGGGYGTLFKIAAETNTLTTLAAFNGANGALPVGNLSFDGNGNFYGATYFGGSGALGTAFKFSLATNTIVKLTDVYPIGTAPQAGLTLDPNGSLYGTTASGGANNVGAVFKLTPNITGGASAPEPSALLLFAPGALGLVAACRTYRKAGKQNNRTGA